MVQDGPKKRSTLVAREQRKTLQTIEAELVDVRRRLDTIYNLVETTPVEMADFPPPPASAPPGAGRSGLSIPLSRRGRPWLNAGRPSTT